jgi:diguanylate cyclase (GGDEF)-like protein
MSMLAPETVRKGAGDGLDNRDHVLALGFYRFLNRMKWPGSYLGRLFFVCTLASTVPLVVVLALVDAISVYSNPESGGIGLATFVAVIGAVLIGVGLMLAGLRSALVPLQLSIAALDTYRRYGSLPELPVSFEDEPGRLMSEIRRTIDSMESVHADLVRRAETDSLTGIANRRALVRIGNDMLVGAQASDRPSSVVLFDIDRFKSINDTYGHSAGDRVLGTVADVVQRMMRPGALFARVGGEEFAILLPAMTLPDAMYEAERLRQTIAALSISELNGARVTASFGVTNTGPAERETDEVLHRADMALYDAKRAGRNCVRARPADETRGTAGDPDDPARNAYAAIDARHIENDGVWLID